MALNIPLPNPLVLPYLTYEKSELDPRDAFYDIPRGGQKPPNERFYTGHGRNEEGGARKNTISLWTNEILIRGLNITIREFMTADLILKEDLLDPILKIYNMKNINSPKNNHLLYSVRTRLLQRFSYLGSLSNDNAYR